MRNFKIFAQELRGFELLVPAETLDEAIAQVKRDPSIFVGNSFGEYIDDSFEINEDYTRDNFVEEEFNESERDKPES